MTPKTPDEIKAEVAKLREMKPRVRHHTGFGDDNWAAIDAQIKVLEVGMNDDEIWDEWPDDERDTHERDSAREALAWMERRGDRRRDPLCCLAIPRQAITPITLPC